MVEFHININNGRFKDAVKAKYLGAGTYLVKQIRTGNNLKVKYIRAKQSDSGQVYVVAEVYPASILKHVNIDNQKIIKKEAV